MTNQTTLNRNVGMLGLRLLLGVIFLMQGYGKIFDAALAKDIASYFDYIASETFLPEWLTTGTAYFTSYTEFLGGILLILGLFRGYVLYAFVLVLIIVSYGHGLMEPIWKMQHVLYRAILLFPLLLLPAEWDKFTLDNLIKSKLKAQ